MCVGVVGGDQRVGQRERGDDFGAVETLLLEGGGGSERDGCRGVCGGGRGDDPDVCAIDGVSGREDEGRVGAGYIELVGADSLVCHVASITDDNDVDGAGCNGELLDVRVLDDVAE